MPDAQVGGSDKRAVVSCIALLGGVRAACTNAVSRTTAAHKLATALADRAALKGRGLRADRAGQFPNSGLARHVCSVLGGRSAEAGPDHRSDAREDEEDQEKRETLEHL